MKILLWVTVLLLAAVWTGGIALLASLANWLAGAGGQVVGAVQTVAEWPVPGWAAVWMDPAWLDGVRAVLTWTIDASATYAPWLFAALGWIAPLLWVLWGLGMAVLLGIAGVGHVLIGRVPPAGAQG
ncbi:MAG: hypothetical protein CFE43_07680 [Burkholderiales bacterium PBB3]|nr:MAG: hypothetical protein CFE43_07680 [Burkholderiales bacterium PBB3]